MAETAGITVQFPTPERTAPVILTQPKNTTVQDTQDTVFFTVQATGENMQYQWKQAGTLMDPETNPSAATPDLRVVVDDVTDSTGTATFACTISNGIGGVTSDTVTLTVA